MTSPQRPHESPSDRAEGSDRGSSGLTPMQRFRSLTRSIIGVTREQMQEQERRNTEAKPAGHKASL